MKYLGCSYYPEDMGIERVPEDIKLMKAAGMNMVRMGEFAWSRMERREGEYDFSLFKEAVDMFARADIDVLMCTPTAAPPAWLTHNYPETLARDAYGHPALHGMRQHCCYNSGKFRSFCLAVTGELARALENCGNIPAWQVDNEPGQRLFGACACPACQEGFREYLKGKYRTVDKLNLSWKNSFWSQDYSSWEEVALAFPEILWKNPPQMAGGNFPVSRVMDSLRFYDKILKEYLDGQAGVIRKNLPGAEVTTNSPSGIFDLESLYDRMDFASADLYWGRNPSFNSEKLVRFRSYKRNKFFVAETGLGYDYLSSASGHKPARLDMWRSFAQGAVSYLIFRWRPAPGGQEQTALCPLTPAGKPRNNYFVAREMFSQVKVLREKLGGIRPPKAVAAILYDSDVEKSYSRHGYGKSINYGELISGVFEQLHRRNIPADFVYPGSGLAGYKLLVLPSQRIARPSLSRKILDFLRSGGTVWAIGELNTADDNGNFLNAGCPEHLEDAFGIAIHTGASIPAGEPGAGVLVEGTLGGRNIRDSLDGCWLADIENRGADVLLRYRGGYYSGQDAFLCSRYGDGLAFYQGMSGPGEDLFSSISQAVIDMAGIEYFRGCPPGVEIIDCGSAVVIINGGIDAVSFKYSAGGRALTGRFDPETGTVTLEAEDICIIDVSAR